MDWGKKWLVDFNARKTQLVSLDRSYNNGSIGYMSHVKQQHFTMILQTFTFGYYFTIHSAIHSFHYSFTFGYYLCLLFHYSLSSSCQKTNLHEPCETVTFHHDTPNIHVPDINYLELSLGKVMPVKIILFLQKNPSIY